MPPAKDLGRLINLNNVRNSIGSPVTEAQKDEIKKDLEAAVSEFTAREEEAFNASHSNPFVTVNNQTNFVATHSRLLHALQLSIDQSVARLGIPPHSGAFDEVSHFHDMNYNLFPSVEEYCSKDLYRQQLCGLQDVPHSS